MNVKTVLFGFVALLTAGATAFLVQNWLDSQRAQLRAGTPPASAPAEAPATQVLVAKRNLPAGTLLTPDDLAWQSWPDSRVAASYALKGKIEADAFAGSVVRVGITAGEPVTADRVVKPGERGFLAAVLREGMRAVTVPVNATTGVGGFVFPGDRVDLILTHQVTVGAGDDAQRRQASETVLSEVRVLAIDQRHDDQEGKPAVVKTATLEVTPKQVEQIAVAMELGKLSLALRSLVRGDDEAPRPAAAPIAAAATNGRVPVQTASASDAPIMLMPTPRTAMPEPEPGRPTYSWDSDVSQLLSHPDTRRDAGHVVHVLRGGAAETHILRRTK